ncbi:hypothetical protein EV138_0027 [Kribbella voronezhensis]|uniref:Uncharacterized protein n=1 Tax=Kribbella voronezhensis TaxID=2512212 RepID=A0A4R7T632_9ACTN|nr:hypothetical protein [Kribbella voronezhensis]TDU86518.1 hypothetical protein EV138_0027 [Kribbella voronezhensis]
MDLVVGFLVAWAAGKARRVLKVVDGLTDDALDAAGERVWKVVAPKLGVDPSIQRLTAEARDLGDATVGTRADAVRALQAAAAADPGFEAQLKAALPAVQHAHSGPSNSGVIASGNTVGRDMKIDNSSTFVNKVRQNPFYAILALAALAFVVWGLSSALGGPAKADASTVFGNWTASDGTGNKSFSSNGQCDGVFYDNGKPLDIGGPMSCALSEKPDSSGFYTLRVTQSMNKATYKLRFDSTDHATVFDSAGRKLYELERF